MFEFFFDANCHIFSVLIGLFKSSFRMLSLVGWYDETLVWNKKFKDV